MVGQTFRRYWPWWITLAWLLAYEVYSVATKQTATLSELYWQGQAAWAPLPFVVVPVVAFLMLHFVFKWSLRALKWWRG